MTQHLCRSWIVLTHVDKPVDKDIVNWWNRLAVPDIKQPVGKLLLLALNYQDSVIPWSRKTKVGMGTQNCNVPRKSNMIISLKVLETGRCPTGQRTGKGMKICQCWHLWFGMSSFGYILDNRWLAASLPVRFAVGTFWDWSAMLRLNVAHVACCDGWVGALGSSFKIRAWQDWGLMGKSKRWTNFVEELKIEKQID